MALVPAVDLKRNLADAALGGIVALGLALPLVGFRLRESAGQSLSIEYRFDWVLWAGAIAFLGRLTIGYVSHLSEGRRFAWRYPARLGEPARMLGLVLIAVGFALPLTPVGDRYVVDVATTALIYVMLGLGLNIVVGLAGLLDLGYVAFYAVGAYTFALLSTHYDFSFWFCLPIAAALAAFAGILLGFPVLRLRGDYLAIVTLGFGEIIRILLINLDWLTGGPNGISGIPRPTFFGHPFTRTAADGRTPFHELLGLEFSSTHRMVFLYYVILALVLLTAFLSERLRRLPIGRAWEALREDEIACRSLGINPTTTKLSAFAIGAAFGGFAGTFFAARQGFVSPESFTFIESAMILAIVVLGGMGSQVGIALAAVAVVALPELAREFAEMRMLVFGAAMVAIMVWRPRGLIGSREPTASAAARDAR